MKLVCSTCEVIWTRNIKERDRNGSCKGRSCEMLASANIWSFPLIRCQIAGDRTAYLGDNEDNFDDPSKFEIHDKGRGVNCKKLKL